MPLSCVACAKLGAEYEKKQESKPDAVNHPAHYGGESNPYEAIKVIDAWQLGFALGNAVKYLKRAKDKGNELEDLKKARWYLDHYIKELEVKCIQPK